MRGIYRWPVDSPHPKDQYRGKCFHLMTSSCVSIIIEVQCMILYFRHIISIILLWQVRKYVNRRFVTIETLDWEHYPDGHLPPTQVATNVVSIIVWNTAGFMDFYVQYFSRSTRDQGIKCQSSWANFVISKLFELSLAYNINRINRWVSLYKMRIYNWFPS